MELKELEEGDQVLFNDRKTPLKVEEVGKNEAFVKGPNGGKYRIRYEKEEDVLLVSAPGNERYSSYCKDLRKVGNWQKEGKLWQHSKSEAKIWLEKTETGYWQIEAENIELDFERPLYGYNDREVAEEDVEKFVRKNPEG